MSTRFPCLQRSLFALASGGLLLSSCLELQEKKAQDSRECTACHGDPTRAGDSVAKAAPPFDTDGNTQVAAPGVGAHARHLEAKGHAQVACTECHVVPDSVFDEGHLDSTFPAEVTFGTLSKQGELAPRYNSNSRTCETSYCHGNAVPKWTEPRDSSKACGSCHGTPPALPHPQQDDCSLCHGNVIDKDRKWIEAKLHVNGRVDIKFNTGCTSCHGHGDNGAPPPDLSGNSDPSSVGAGAHVTHLEAGNTHAAVACTECHVVPATVEEPSHLGADRRAEVTFGGLARTQSHQPQYDPIQHACQDSYCHGVQQLAWTSPRNSRDACGSCHGTPPPLPHPQAQDCSRCHSAVIGPNQTFAHPELHVDGTLQLNEGPQCSRCHGTGDNGRVPPDLSGNSSPSSRGVGAHENHLLASETHGALPCSLCHQVPTQVDSAGHIDNDGRAEVKLTGLANQDNANSSYDSATMTCAGSYCHGKTTANWQAPRSPANACGSCHGLPPLPPHSPRSDCASCHGTVIDTNRRFTAPERHVDGKVDLNDAGCSLCHGSTLNAAPPTDLTGSDDRTRVSVGAHQGHLSGGNSSRKVACTECHIVPATVDQAGHLDDFGLAEVVITGPATTRSHVATWDHATASCSNNYCHDPSSTGNLPPSWVATNANLTCTSCHALPPKAPHIALTQCSLCHSDVDSSNNITDKTRHVNGVVDF